MNEENTIKLSNWKMTMINSCWKKYFYMYEEKLAPKIERIPALQIGDLVHVGIAAYFHPTNFDLEKTERLELGRQAMKAHFESQEDMIDPQVLQDSMVLFPCISQEPENFRPISVEQFQDVEVGELSVTQPTIVEEIKIPIILTIKMDGLVIHDKDQKLYVMENKTANAQGFGQKAEIAEMISQQSKCYAYGGMMAYKKPIEGVLYNFLLKKSVPELRRKWQVVSPRDIERFENNLFQVAQEILDRRKSNIWREDLTQCHHRLFGDCPFVPLCEFGDDPQTREQLYTVKEKDESWQKNRKLVVKNPTPTHQP